MIRAQAGPGRAVLGRRSVMEILCVLLVVLGLVTVLGHGIWVVLAALCRALAPDQPRTSARTRPAGHANPPTCVRCKNLLLPWDKVCPQCGLPRDHRAAAELRELEITAGQIRRLLKHGE